MTSKLTYWLIGIAITFGLFWVFPVYMLFLLGGFIAGILTVMIAFPLKRAFNTEDPMPPEPQKPDAQSTSGQTIFITNHSPESIRIKCAHCGTMIDPTKFMNCPNCGAKV